MWLPPADATLELQRRDRMDLGDFHILWLDGQRVAGVPCKGSVRLPVASGDHELLLTDHRGRVRSKPVPFSLAPGETARFSSATNWPKWADGLSRSRRSWIELDLLP